MITLAVVVFGYIGYKIDWNNTWQSVKNAYLPLILLAACTMIFAHFIRAYRWNMLTQTNGYTLNVRRSFYSVMIGYLLNTATSRGGEVVRCAMTAKSEKTPVEILIGTVITERIIDLFSLIFMFLVCLLLQFQEMFGFVNTQVFIPLKNNLIWVVLSLVIGILLLWIWKKYQVKKPKNEASFLQKLLNGMNSIFLIKKPIKFIFLSLLIWFCYWFSLYFQLESLEITQHLTPGNALGILIFSAIGIIIPVPGGAGAWGPIAYGMTFIYHLNQTNAESFGIFTIAFSILLQVIVGGVCYGLLFYEMQKNDENQRAES
jgi:uncharacterized protein (TIRG00374 family)